MTDQKLEDSYGPLVVVRHKKTKLERLARVVGKVEEVTEMLNRELSILPKLDHPYVLKLVEVWEGDTNLYLLYESLIECKIVPYSEIAGKLAEVELANIAMQLLQALKYCHTHSVLHGNLSLKNILFLQTKSNSIAVKVMGVGAGRKSAQEKDLSPDGLVTFFAPEVFTRSFSEKADVWACGVVLYFLASGQLPFRGSCKSDLRLVLENSDVDFPFLLWDTYGLDIQRFLRSMITNDPADRASVHMCISNGWLEQFFHLPTEALIANALTRLQAFRGGRKLKISVLSFLSANVICTDDWLKLTKAFNYIDSNGENLVRNEDLLAAFSKHFPKKDAISIVSRLMDSLDFDKNGYLTCAEFLVAACNEDSLLTEAKLRISFDLLDQDDSGKIKLRELTEGLKCGKENSEWQALLKDVDKNSDGELDFDEFVELMRKAVQ